LASASNPDAEHKMAQLVRSCAGIYDAAKIFKAPFISGKDSMKNDFLGVTKAGNSIKISVPPTLLISAIGGIDDKTKIIQSSFKNDGDLIYLIGNLSNSLMGSVYLEHYSKEAITQPEILDLSINQKLYQNLWSCIQNGSISSAHDISDGGFLVAVSESCFGNQLGCQLNLSIFSWNQLWSEIGTGIVISVPSIQKQSIEKIFGDRAMQIGEVIKDYNIQIKYHNEKTSIVLTEARKSWRYGMRQV
jgi:phosphoribosylformylglycinamidine synthase